MGFSRSVSMDLASIVRKNHAPPVSRQHCLRLLVRTYDDEYVGISRARLRFVKIKSSALDPTNKGRRPTPAMTIGVLALQGDFDAHRRRLEELGAHVVLVRKPEQLDHVEGLVIPGGESGTFLKLLGEEGFEKLKQFVRVKPTFGTCAGAILLATEVENPRQAGLGAIDIGIRRNAYGRQLESSIRQGKLLQSSLNDKPGS